MTYKILEIFDNLGPMSRVKTKAQYEKMTEDFKSRNMANMQELFAHIDGEADKAAAMQTVAADFAQETFDSFAKRGKVKGTDQMNLSYFMIYYVFPTILTERTEDGEAICDAMKEAFNTRFKANISYTDYETLYNGFVTKIFGIQFGKKD